MLVDTQQRLDAWGHWVRAGGVALGCKAVDLGVGGTVSLPMCSDDAALQVDSAVARLKKRDPEMGRVLVMAYLSQLSLTKMAKHSGLGSRERCRYLLGAAEAWVDAVLHVAQS